MADPVFNLAHPPLMTDPDTFPPLRTADEVVGKPFEINAADFGRVRDPKYPWPDMNHTAPEDEKKWKDLQDKQKNEVGHYVVVRSRYWSRFNRYAFGAETEEEYTYEVGTTYKHEAEQKDTTTTQVGTQLGVNLGGDMFGGGEAPPIPPVAPLALARNARRPAAKEEEAGGGEGGGGDDGEGDGGDDSFLSAKFTYNFSHTLEFTKSDEESYEKKTTVTKKQSFEFNTQYIYWQIIEDLATYRVPKGSDNDKAKADEKNRIGHVISKTSQRYVQPFNMDPKPKDKAGAA